MTFPLAQGFNAIHMVVIPMPRIIKPLTDKEARTAKTSKAVGGTRGLSVKVHTSKEGITTRCFELRTMIAGERLYFRIGSTDDYTLAQARAIGVAKLAEWQDKANRHISNLSHKQGSKTQIFTVNDLYEKWLQAQLNRGRWSGQTGEKTVQDMRSRFLRYLPENVRALPAEELTATVLAEVLTPRWNCVNQSCSRMCNTLSNAYAWGIRFQLLPSMINPATLSNGLLGDLLPIHEARIKHMGALPVDKVPDFFYTLVGGLGSVSPTALFIAYSILTAARPGSILNARWDEIDFEQKYHIIPRERMKIKGIQFNRITPLSNAAMRILSEVPRRKSSTLIFASPRNPSVPIVQEAYATHIKRMCRTGDWHDPYQTNRRGQPARMTVHGTGRATFKDWAKDARRYHHDRFEESLIERCLDHSEGYSGAYTREQPVGDMREIFEEWGNFCFSKIW